MEGSALKVFFADESAPAIAVTDGSLGIGDFPGIRAFSETPGAAWFDNFDLTTPFSDTFTRANSTDLGSAWSEYLPNLELFSNQLRNATANTTAARLTQAIGPDQNVAVYCKVTAAGNACGVMARWSSESNFYRLRLDAGTQDLALMKTVNGTTTLIGKVPRPLSMNTSYRIRLIVKGSALSVFFGNEEAPALTATDTSITQGDFAGIRGFGSAAYTTWFDNFAAGVAERSLGGAVSARISSAKADSDAVHPLVLELSDEPASPSAAPAAAGGCALTPGAEFDPTLIGMLGMVLAYLGWKRIIRR